MKLSHMQLTDFVQTLASDSPAPGGGSAAALFGAMGAGLASMVACLTQGRKKYEQFAQFAAMVEINAKALEARLLDVMDRDTEAFTAVSAAFAMPKDTEEQKAERSAAIQAGRKACTETPLECMELCAEAIDLSFRFLSTGYNQSSASDLGVAFLALKSAMQGAWLNVLINLSSIKDPAFTDACRARGEELLSRAISQADEGYERVLALVRE